MVAFESPMLDIQVVILAAGKATRLRPLSVDRPKTLCPVCNVPLLSRLLTQLQSAGIDKAVVSLPTIGEDTPHVALSAAPPGFNLEVFLPGKSFDGTVPQVRHLLDPGASSVLVIYGDSLLSVDFNEIMTFHNTTRARGGLATVLYHRPADLRLAEKDGRTYHGVMSINEKGRVNRFVEKPVVEEIKPGFDLANAAVFICERALLEQSHFTGAKDFSFDIFQPAVNKEIAPIYACSIGDGFRFDVGGIGRFFDANIKVLRRELRGFIPGKEEGPGFWRGENTNSNSAAITPPVLLGNGVQVGQNVELGPDVVIGDACRIDDGAVIRRAVIMENCRIGTSALIDLCILGPNSKVVNNAALPPYTLMGPYAAIGAEDWPS